MKVYGIEYYHLGNKKIMMPLYLRREKRNEVLEDLQSKSKGVLYLPEEYEVVE